MTSRVSVRVVAIVLAVVALSEPAAAQMGLRAGVSGSPDQAFFGVHTETGPLVERLRFRPNVELGVGDDVTLVALNLEFAWRIPIRRRPFDVYLGAGPAVNVYSAKGRGGDGVEGGFNILLGLEHRDGLFAELKVGALDSPSVKFAVGYVFRD